MQADAISAIAAGTVLSAASGIAAGLMPWYAPQIFHTKGSSLYLHCAGAVIAGLVLGAALAVLPAAIHCTKAAIAQMTLPDDSPATKFPYYSAIIGAVILSFMIVQRLIAAADPASSSGTSADQQGTADDEEDALESYIHSQKPLLLPSTWDDSRMAHVEMLPRCCRRALASRLGERRSLLTGKGSTSRADRAGAQHAQHPGREKSLAGVEMTTQSQYGGDAEAEEEDGGGIWIPTRNARRASAAGQHMSATARARSEMEKQRKAAQAARSDGALSRTYRTASAVTAVSACHGVLDALAAALLPSSPLLGAPDGIGVRAALPVLAMLVFRQAWQAMALMLPFLSCSPPAQPRFCWLLLLLHALGPLLGGAIGLVLVELLPAAGYAAHVVAALVASVGTGSILASALFDVLPSALGDDRQAKTRIACVALGWLIMSAAAASR